MNFFNPNSRKNQTPPPAPPSQPRQPPPLEFLSQAFTSFQSNFSNFIHDSPLSALKNPPWASTSNAITSSNTANPSSPSSSSAFQNRRTSFDNKNGSLPMSIKEIEERLAGVPVYALSNSSEEFVLVSGSNSGKNLGLFCFNEADAQTLLKEMKSVDPSMGKGSQVVPVALNKVFQLKVDGVAFRLIPEPSQVKHAITEMKKDGTSEDSFYGVPVFQSKSLLLKSQNKRYRPVFFRKEDLEKSLVRASQSQHVLNPAFRAGNVKVAVLEDIIQEMKDGSPSQWDDVVFIPPGYDVSTVQSRK
ncbi:OLC1v1018927C1 [Oldenlandia corymbosa var. corymbosa]|uniref:OLC1v1018927C1 n=1 Tax=Oldenlandia corymbosa var. corymbosa TaxID=529605 RepID=A0AAV1ED91_OLDCO|nr:OLC1v1018927C1 [Oldenlandia corymbosa var. corymbosa]